MTENNNYQNIDSFFTNLNIGQNNQIPIPNNVPINLQNNGNNQNQQDNNINQTNVNRGRNTNGFQTFINGNTNQGSLGGFSTMFANRRESWE